MEHILHNSFDAFVDKNTKLIIKKSDSLIFEVKVPTPDYSADTIDGSKSTAKHSFIDDDFISYELFISSSLGNLEYDLYSDEYIDDCDIEIINVDNLITDTDESYISTYVPLIKYTAKTKELVNKTIASAENKDIFPLIDIRKEKNITKYIDDNFDIPHFLDLCDLHKITNEEEREKIKDFRKEHKGEDNLPEIPDEEEILLTKSEMVDKYIFLSDYLDFVPVCRIDTSHSADLEYAKNATKLLSKFDTVSIRIVSHSNFKANIQSYLIPFFDILSKSYLIIEFSGTNNEKEKEIIKFTSSLNTDMAIIYAKETIDFKKNTIHINHYNVFPNTSLSSYIDRLSDSCSTLWYSDYCGYDRNTATEYIIGMKPNASLYLLDNSDALNILILKIKEKSERGTAGWKKSVQLLVDTIQKGKIDGTFLQNTHCEACDILTSTKSLNLASAKFLSMLHNCITIAKI